MPGEAHKLYLLNKNVSDLLAVTCVCSVELLLLTITVAVGLL